MHLPQARAVVPSLRFEPRVTSTNQILAQEHKELADFSVLVAAEQTQGQGRAGRDWISDPETSLSASILLRPKNPNQAGMVTILIAAGLHSGLKTLYPDVPFEIKWPNDILVEGRKLAGILAQLNPDGSVVVGFGINLELPSQIENASAISDFATADFDLLLSECLKSIKSHWQALLETDKFNKAITYFRENCSTIGLMVRADLANGESIIGRATEVTEDGRLMIQADEQHLLSAADVWHLRRS